MTDTYPTTDKTLEVTYIGHASVMFRYGDEIIHVDPYGDIADYSGLPKADLILITHHHGDHLDSFAIADIEKPSTQIIGSPLAIRELGRGQALKTEKKPPGTNSAYAPQPPTTGSPCVRRGFRSILKAKETAICSKWRTCGSISLETPN